MSFFGFQFGSDDRVATSTPEARAETPNSQSSGQQPQSFLIKVESDGEREMTQDEVSKLVHSALRRARKATASKGERLSSPLSANSTPNSSVHGTYSRTPPSRHRSPPDMHKVGISDSNRSQSEIDHLRSPTMDSLIGSVPSNYSMMSANSSDDVLRKVEEEIQAARRAALQLTKRANLSRGIDEPQEIVLSPTSELMGILDDHLADDEDLRSILDTSDALHETPTSIFEETIFETAQREMEAEFAETPPHVVSPIRAATLSPDKALSLRLGYNPEPKSTAPIALRGQSELVLAPEAEKLGEMYDEVVSDALEISIDETRAVFEDIHNKKKLREEVAIPEPVIEHEEKKVEESESVRLQQSQEIMKTQLEFSKGINPEDTAVSVTELESGNEDPTLNQLPSESEAGPNSTAIDRHSVEHPEEEGFEAEDVMIEWRPTEDSITDVQKEKGIDATIEGQIQAGDGTDDKAKPHTIDEKEVNPDTAQISTKVIDGDLESITQQNENEFDIVPHVVSTTLVEDTLEEKKSETSPAKDSMSGKRSDSDYTEMTVNDVPIGSEVVMPNNDCGGYEGTECEIDDDKSEYTEETVSDDNEEGEVEAKATPTDQELKPTIVDNGSANNAPPNTASENLTEETGQSNSNAANLCLDGKPTPMTAEDLRPAGISSLVNSKQFLQQRSDSDGQSGVLLQKHPLSLETEQTTLDPKSDKIQFRHPYPFPPPLAKPRPAAIVIQENRLGIPEPFTRWSRTNPELEKLIIAARDDSLQRRSNACGALKVLSQKKKNQVALVRTSGFLDSMVFSIAAEIQSNHETDIALDSRARAVSTLLNVSEPKGNRQLIAVHPGVVQCLLKVVEDDLGEARVQACATIALLAKTPANREFLATAPSLLDVLAVILLGSIVEEEVEISRDEDEEQKGSLEDSTEYGSDGEEEGTSAGRSIASSTVDDDATNDDEDNTHYDEETTRIGSENSSVGRSSSMSSTRPPLKGRSMQKSIRDQQEALHDQFLRQARVNACAALMHLSKHCAVSVSWLYFELMFRI